MNALVVGVGSPAGGDDRAGLLVAGQVAARGLPDVRVRTCTAPSELVLLCAGEQHVVVVDAVAGSRGRDPVLVQVSSSGELVREPAPPPTRGAAGPDPFAGPASTHGLGVAEALELLAAMGQLPVCLQVVAVPGESFAPSLDPPGPALLAQVDKAVEVVEQLVAGHPR